MWIFFKYGKNAFSHKMVFSQSLYWEYESVNLLWVFQVTPNVIFHIRAPARHAASNTAQAPSFISQYVFCNRTFVETVKCTP